MEGPLGCVPIHSSAYGVLSSMGASGSTPWAARRAT
eukprot:CAMPEP_0185559752 /NCGR_PEP_ID=MMETSP1381-20130426/55300_1 /TAXON_ID=298111 /ORGANISM="Pavlova sp., Strain CCMP459" /LENGTH=35 /DNA_ID= /DNA_START= /DNA_END= /DNA_ORIENTATION=